LSMSGGIYWDSLKMPMEKWIEANKTMDMRLMHISGGYNERQALKARQRIQDLIIDHFGVSEKIKLILRKKLYIVNEWKKVIIDGERHRKVFIQIAEKELENLMNEKSVTTYIESVMNMRMATRLDLNYQKITIEEYFTTIKIIEKNGRKEGAE